MNITKEGTPSFCSSLMPLSLGKSKLLDRTSLQGALPLMPSGLLLCPARLSSFPPLLGSLAVSGQGDWGWCFLPPSLPAPQELKGSLLSAPLQGTPGEGRLVLAAGGFHYPDRIHVLYFISSIFSVIQHFKVSAVYRSADNCLV